MIGLGWKQTLAHIYNETSSMFVRGNIEKKFENYDTPQEYVNATMQQKHPGPYVVEEYYNPALMRFCYQLKFENPVDETFWMLQNT